MNPYRGVTFFQFFETLFDRMGNFIQGNLGWQDLATDEIQLLVLLGIAISCAFVGTFLVLRKMTMLANSISHTILLGIVAAYFLLRGTAQEHDGFFSTGPMLCAALGMGIITAYLTNFFTHSVHLQEDASTGLVFTTLFALGIILVTLLTRNVHIGTEVVMGNIDALQVNDLFMVYGIMAVNVICFWLFFKELVVTTFDASLAKGLGISPGLFNYFLMSLVSLTVVGAFRAVGVIMVLAMITAPPLIARMLTDNLKTMIAIGIAVGIAASLVGVALARHLLSAQGLAFSTAGVVVTILSLFFILTVLAKKIGTMWTKPRRIIN